MIFLLDTNICIYALQGRFPALRENLSKHPPSELAIPAIVRAELHFGACKSTAREKTTRKVAEFLEPFAVLPFGDDEALRYGELRAETERLGTPIGANDLLIAATALARGATVVTHNLREFSRAPGLLLQDWTV